MGYPSQADLTNGRWELPAHARGVSRQATPTPPNSRALELDPLTFSLGIVGILALPFIARDAIRTSRASRRTLTSFLRKGDG